MIAGEQPVGSSGSHSAIHTQHAMNVEKGALEESYAREKNNVFSCDTMRHICSFWESSTIAACDKQLLPLLTNSDVQQTCTDDMSPAPTSPLLRKTSSTSSRRGTVSNSIISRLEALQTQILSVTINVPYTTAQGSCKKLRHISKVRRESMSHPC